MLSFFSFSVLIQHNLLEEKEGWLKESNSKIGKGKHHNAFHMLKKREVAYSLLKRNIILLQIFSSMSQTYDDMIEDKGRDIHQDHLWIKDKLNGILKETAEPNFFYVIKEEENENISEPVNSFPITQWIFA